LFGSFFVDTLVLARGFILGFSIAATFGPIGLLCLRRTLAAGFLIGFLSGLGAASADAAYASLAAFGVSALTALLVDHRLWLRLVGGAFLVYLGVRTLRTPPSRREAAASSARGLVSAYLSTLALTLNNPMTILSFVGIFAGLGLGAAAGAVDGVAMVAGVSLAQRRGGWYWPAWSADCARG
jgi:threonine/homoserine/homoserine lactone efflux protein